MTSSVDRFVILTIRNLSIHSMLRRLFCIALVGSGLLWGCAQYPYDPPEPGILTITMRPQSAEIQPSVEHFFGTLIDLVAAIRPDNAKVDIFETLHAIRRLGPTLYNVLSVPTSDSGFVIGESFVPPGKYSTVEFLITPLDFLFLDGYRQIPVRMKPGADNLVRVHIPQFEVAERRHTTVVLLFDLDASLRRRHDHFEFEPVFVVSSIQVSGQ